MVRKSCLHLILNALNDSFSQESSILLFKIMSLLTILMHFNFFDFDFPRANLICHSDLNLVDWLIDWLIYWIDWVVGLLNCWICLIKLPLHNNLTKLFINERCSEVRSQKNCLRRLKRQIYLFFQKKLATCLHGI